MQWVVFLLLVTIGILGGLGAFTFNYAQGLSYFSNDPQNCANCHIMDEYLDSWQKGPHHNWATCNDCHTPHSFIPKMLSKADNGWNHSVKFTLQTYTDPIQIREVNREKLRHNCIECHSDFIDEVLIARGAASHGAHAGAPGEESIDCLRCHSGAGHGPTL